MKKQILTVVLLTISSWAFAQGTDLPKIVGDTLITSSGYKIVEGQNVKIGTGTMPDADFKFIRINSASLLNYSSTKGYNGLANQANSFPRSNSGLSMKVAKVEARGSKKRGYAYYAVLAGFVRYEVDVENAIKSGELEVPEEFRPKDKKNTTGSSAADELKKYKDLLDSGAITQEEYDAKKKQLLKL